MINLGTKHIRIDRDGWTTRTYDGMPSAHYEHMCHQRKRKRSFYQLMINRRSIK
jgi:hypothetical protein